MLDVHPPHEAVHSWKAFFIHIATIVIGLFIAIGLEQTVEYFHHRHVSAHLEEQIREVLESNVETDAESVQTLGHLRAYLLDVRAAIIGRLEGRKDPAPPPSDDPRMLVFKAAFPSLAPYDAAKQSGTVAYLPTERVRIYGRLAFQREILLVTRDRWVDAITALGIFNERYEDSAGISLMVAISKAPDIEKLSHAELTEYLNVVAALIKQNDMMIGRITYFDAECRAVLGGVKTERELVKAVRAAMSGSPDSAPPAVRN